jgi:hypothetical protein
MGAFRRLAILPRLLFHFSPVAGAFCLALSATLWLDLLQGDSSQAAASASEERTTSDLESLQEANRLLEEEIKLASRPQIYLFLDLAEQILYIKGRGLELHRLPVLGWRVSGGGPVSGSFRLRARPEIVRPKVDPGKDPSLVLEPINLQDMPAEYLLFFEPDLLLAVAPPVHEQPWLWTKSRLREWWARLTSWARLAAPADRVPAGSRLRLTLSQEAARSLAWTVTDGMPLLIGRTAQP